MVKIDGEYTDFHDDTDLKYPYGKAVAASAPGNTDGTPWRALFFNDLIGARQAIFRKAFDGTTRLPSNKPDDSVNSDLLDAILKIISDSFFSAFFTVDINGLEVIVPWSKFGITYDKNKTYAAWVKTESVDDFYVFNTEIKGDGVHIYPRILENGALKPITLHVRWGDRKWGEGKWGEYGGAIRVSILLRETKFIK